MKEGEEGLRAYWRILLRWWWLFILGVVGAAVAAFFVSKAMTPIYEASTKVLVQGGQAPGLPTVGEIQASRQLAQSYGDLIRTRPVMGWVVETLALPYGPEALSAKISVTSPRSLIEIKVSDPDPQMAAEIANATTRAFINDFRDRQFTQIAQFQASLAQYEISQDPSIIAAQAATMGALSIVEEAVAPSAPSSPRTGLNVILAAVLGLMMSGLVVFVLEYLDDSIESPEELRRIADLEPVGSVSDGLTFLGSVVRHRYKSGAFPIIISTRDGSTPLAESYKYVALSLSFSSSRPDNPMTMLITSALPSEGKTTTATNLAITLARKGKSVVLVDADLRKPALHTIFALENRKGLTNVLLGDADVDEVLSPTPIEALRVVSSGPRPPDPTLALGSPRMREMLAEFATRAEIVIVDCSPVLAVADSIALASLVDGVILVVDAQRGRRRAIQHAVESLQQTNTQLLGTVLNRVHVQGRGAYYHYYGHDSEVDSKPRGRHADWFEFLPRLFRRGKGSQEGGGSDKRHRPATSPGVLAKVFRWRTGRRKDVGVG
ncbi:polysaccharide biosynthesis tyrosine autokinase [Chloroflexota bacterium]